MKGSKRARDSPSDELTTIYRMVTTAAEYVVRLYVLRGLNMVSSDANGRIDAYLNVILGSQRQDRRKSHLKDVVNADFYEVRSRFCPEPEARPQAGLRALTPTPSLHAHA